MAYKAEHTFRNIKKKKEDDDKKDPNKPNITYTPVSTLTPKTTQTAKKATPETTKKPGNAFVNFLLYCIFLLSLYALSRLFIIYFLPSFAYAGKLTYGGEMLWIIATWFIAYFVSEATYKYWHNQSFGLWLFFLSVSLIVYWGYRYQDHRKVVATNQAIERRERVKWDKEFLGSFNDSKIDSRTQAVKVLTWNGNYMIGDKLEIDGIVPAGAKEINILNCNNTSPKWYKTVNGKFEYIVSSVPPSGTPLLAWIQPKAGVFFKVHHYKQIRRSLYTKSGNWKSWERKFIGEFNDYHIDSKDHWIYTMTWTSEYNTPVYIEIIGTVPPGAKEISIFNCKYCEPRTDKTTNGYYGKYIKRVSTGEKLAVWIDEGKGVSFKLYTYKLKFR